jgi:hypothetical protein
MTRELVKIVIWFVGLLFVASAGVMMVKAGGIEDNVERVVSPPALTDGCESVIGHGAAYGQRGARQEIMIWDCCGTFRIRLTKYGEPTSPHQLNGPVESLIETVLPDEVYSLLRSELNTPDTCSVVTP